MPTFGFDNNGVKRIVDAVRKAERTTIPATGGSGAPGSRDYPTPMHLGKLSASLTSTGTASVTLWGATQASTVDEASLGTTETAYNWSGITMSSGSNVVLMRHYGSGRLYAIGDGGNKAKFIEFQLQQTITSTDQTSNVLLKDWYGGAAPGAANSTIVVYNTPDSTGYWFTGKPNYVGVAVLDDIEDIYTIWNLQQPQSSDFTEVYFTPTSTAASSIFPVTMTFVNIDDKTGGVIPSSLIINFLNSSHITGYSTGVSIQILTRTSTGLQWTSPSTCTT